MAAMVLMTEEDLDALRAAAATLEHPALAARLGNIAGKPIELVGRALPEAASEAVAAATTKALEAALAVALRTMEKEPKAAWRLWSRRVAGRTPDLDHHHAAVDRRRRAQRGRGSRGPGERPRLPAGVRPGDARW